MIKLSHQFEESCLHAAEPKFSKQFTSSMHHLQTELHKLYSYMEKTDSSGNNLSDDEITNHMC